MRDFDILEEIREILLPPPYSALEFRRRLSFLFLFCENFSAIPPQQNDVSHLHYQHIANFLNSSSREEKYRRRFLLFILIRDLTVQLKLGEDLHELIHQVEQSLRAEEHNLNHDGSNIHLLYPPQLPYSRLSGKKAQIILFEILSAIIISVGLKIWIGPIASIGYLTYRISLPFFAAWISKRCMNQAEEAYKTPANADNMQLFSERADRFYLLSWSLPYSLWTLWRERRQDEAENEPNLLRSLVGNVPM